MGMFIILLLLTILYALALLILIPIVFLLGSYIISLFENDLFTQEDPVIAFGMFLILLSLVFDFIASLIMAGFRATLYGDPDEPLYRRSSMKVRILYLVIPILVLISYVIIDLFLFDGNEALLFFIWVGILIGFFFFKWKVIDIPAKALAFIGNEASLRRSRTSSIPLVIFVFSFFALLLSFRFEDAPTGTIVIVYLESLFFLAILINIVNFYGVVNDIGREMKRSSD
jgi:hypothetical protein